MKNWSNSAISAGFPIMNPLKLAFPSPAKRTVRALVRSASACAGVEEQRQGLPRLLAGVGRRSDAARGPARCRSKLPTLPLWGSDVFADAQCASTELLQNTRGGYGDGNR